MNVIRGKKTDKEIRDAAEAAGVTPEEIGKVLNIPQGEVDARWEGAGGPFDTSGNTTVLDTKPTVLNTVGQGPTIADRPPTEVIDTPTSPGGGGGGGGSAYDMLVPQFRQVDVGESPLAEIDYLFDIGGESIFAPKTGDPDEESDNLARIRSLGGIPYAPGGQVDIVELARQLLRG
jgi:hypothetical protein